MSPQGHLDTQCDVPGDLTITASDDMVEVPEESTGSTSDEDIEEHNDAEAANDSRVTICNDRDVPDELTMSETSDDTIVLEIMGVSEEMSKEQTYPTEKGDRTESIQSTQSSLRSLSSSVLAPSEKGLSVFTTTCIVVNYISSGYVLLPWGFTQAGTLLSTAGLVLICAISLITCTYVLETCARAEALDNVIPTSERSTHRRPTLPRQYSMEIYKRKFEVPELTRIFLGPRARNFFTFTGAFSLFGGGWAVSAVFAAALADQFPLDGIADNYRLYLLLFGVLAIPLACVPILNQKGLQLCFLAGRTVMLLLMLCTLAAAYLSDTPHFDMQSGPAKDIPLADFSGLVIMLQLAIFSTSFQLTVPGITGCSKNKRTMKKTLGSAMVYILATNLLLSLMVSIFFGKNTQESNNLNWLSYHGGSWDGIGDVKSSRAGWATFISSYVVLFSAIDGLSVFPLWAVALGDVLMAAVYGPRVHECKNDWKKRSAFRIVVSVTEIGCAFAVRDLGAIAKYTGIFTLLSSTVCPSLLEIFSRKRLKRDGLPLETWYGTPFSTGFWGWCLFGFSLLLITAVFLEAILS